MSRGRVRSEVWGADFGGEGQVEGDITGADPLLAPLGFTTFPSISKPSVGRLPSGRADLSPTGWQSTDRDTLTWLTDRWTCNTEVTRQRHQT